eukprot:1656358-Pyramimonas_sp.AAC.1
MVATLLTKHLMWTAASQGKPPDGRNSESGENIPTPMDEDLGDKDLEDICKACNSEDSKRALETCASAWECASGSEFSTCRSGHDVDEGTDGGSCGDEKRHGHLSFATGNITSWGTGRSIPPLVSDSILFVQEHKQSQGRLLEIRRTLRNEGWAMACAPATIE